MTDPRRLYPEAILEHSRNPRNEGALADATHRHRLSNPLCGDRVTVAARVEGDHIVEARFEARGCALCVASASMLTEWVRGCSIEGIAALRSAVERAVDPSGEAVEPPIQVWTALRDFPARRRCATLPWETLTAALATFVPGTRIIRN